MRRIQPAHAFAHSRSLLIPPNVQASAIREGQKKYHAGSVGNGGKAIAGNVTQHARVILPDKKPASAARKAPKAAGSRRRRNSAGCQTRSTGMSDHIRNTGPMLASLRCGAKTRCGCACRSPAVYGRKRCRMHGGAKGSGAPRANRNARKHGLFTRDAIAERRQIRTLLEKSRRLLDEMK